MGMPARERTVVQLFLELRPLLQVHRFCFIKLGLAARELQTMSWAQLVSRVVAAQGSMRLCVVKELTALDMVRGSVCVRGPERISPTPPGVLHGAPVSSRGHTFAMRVGSGFYLRLA
jgi:hypothetical protein